jgi:hypothetical protein
VEDLRSWQHQSDFELLNHSSLSAQHDLSNQGVTVRVGLREMVWNGMVWAPGMADTTITKASHIIAAFSNSAYHMDTTSVDLCEHKCGYDICCIHAPVPTEAAFFILD